MLKKTCFSNTKQPLKAFRLQDLGASATKLIGLEFGDENSKWEFLKRVNTTQREQKIFCKLDESKEVRDQQHALRQQIKQLKLDNKEDSTQYRIRNIKIQAKKQSRE